MRIILTTAFTSLTLWAEPAWCGGTSDGCCTLTGRACITWCGDTEDDCNNCDSNDVFWISDGPPRYPESCLAHWQECVYGGHPECCPGLECPVPVHGYSQCLPEARTEPTDTPTIALTDAHPTDYPTTDDRHPPTDYPTSTPIDDRHPTYYPTTPLTDARTEGCCSLDAAMCIDYCGTSQYDCETCPSSQVIWLPHGAPHPESCSARWLGCNYAHHAHESDCCDELNCCAPLSCECSFGYCQCLVGDEH